MQQFLSDTRKTGLLAGALLALAAVLPWMSVTAPFIGTVTVYGIQSGGDGWIALSLGVIVGALAWFRLRLWFGIAGVATVLLYGYEFVQVLTVKSQMTADMDDSEFGRSLADAVSVAPSFGLFLGILAALGLVFYGLVMPRIKRFQPAEVALVLEGEAA